MQLIINYLPEELNEYLDLLRAAETLSDGIRVADQKPHKGNKSALVFVDTPGWHERRKEILAERAKSRQVKNGAYK